MIVRIMPKSHGDPVTWARSIMTSERRAVHVVPHPVEGWSVLLAGASRAYRVFPSRDEAVEFARPWAKRRETDLVVHRETGAIDWADRWLP